MKKSRGVISNKERLSKKVSQIARQCKSLDALAQELQKQHIKPYYRNQKFVGVWLGNRKFRLTTIGIGKQHLKQLTLEQERLNNLSKFRKNKSKSKNRNRGLER